MRAIRSARSWASPSNDLGITFGGLHAAFGSLPKFPYIGGAQAVAGWNSASCGSCWNLTYTNTKKVSKSISVLAVDHADSGFNIALEAMNALTGGIAEELGRISVTSKQIASSHCGL
ncbi:Cerato-platanin [Athelia psychrophila]|uniref:Cerato-platanin n=1 Tax=Athelia psychrophila TaxID=1759441 RepID=A0A167VQ94_9AGAM|nr:Cerato-platanin [Fibularhizoctonia sp. CBS 109695]